MYVLCADVGPETSPLTLNPSVADLLAPANFPLSSVGVYVLCADVGPATSPATRNPSDAVFDDFEYFPKEISYDHPTTVNQVVKTTTKQFTYHCLRLQCKLCVMKLDQTDLQQF
eukprot:TRINITY_DN661_c0_g1_i4.p2 TRINITY_DN661_c0_g1~~TRINITY_DN661_c0_g1_i4.p2  ORF type:complete len:114 (-),score=4.40 TRINITY_DN661_c0_g1_i4:975-1316(-)